MKTRLALYLAGDSGPDNAIVKGLQQADCEVLDLRTVRDTFDRIRVFKSHEPTSLLILIADVQAGAIPLLILVHDFLGKLPPTLLFDRKGDDINAVVKALQLGVREYILSTEPEINRELSARLLAERTGTEQQHELAHVMASQVEQSSPAQSAPSTPEGFDSQFQWDPIGHVLHLGDSFIRMSPIEGRIFDMLLNNHNRTVPMTDLVQHVLTNPNVDVESGVKQLRPHIVRLRRKLERYPSLSNRILNMRGAGYMFI